jgi:peptidoglycan/LPS O-acetylase OafA/YrhL
MSKQRKFVLISSAVGFVSMFLPWVSISILGYTQSVNGMHDKGILVFICFIAGGLIAYMGDQTKNLDKTMWSATLVAGAIALLFTIWFYAQATSSIMGSSFIGFGVYIAAVASVGILSSAYLFRSPGDNLKDGFNNMKREIESKIGTGRTSANSSSTSETFVEPPIKTMDEKEDMNPEV